MLNVPSRARAAGAYAPAARLSQIEALARTCPLCESKPREWCVRVVKHGPVSKERGEMLYPVRLKNLHPERLIDTEEDNEDAG